jgi:hypothetical protein
VGFDRSGLEMDFRQKSSRKFRMFKKRVKQLDIFEEAKKRNQRTWNRVDE